MLRCNLHGKMSLGLSVCVVARASQFRRDSGLVSVDQDLPPRSMSSYLSVFPSIAEYIQSPRVLSGSGLVCTKMRLASFEMSSQAVLLAVSLKT